MNERILVVDDTPENIQMLAGVLKGKGYQISVATNGKQALEVLERIQPDLILLDVMMPELDGFETCRRIKSSEPLRNIPIIFLTAKTETSDIVKGFEVGAVDYVAKPFNVHELLARVNTHLTVDQLRRSLAEKNVELARAHAREVEMAHRVQSQLIPLQTPQLPGWEFAASWQPARDLSGDYYDFIHNDNRMGIVIADVSGKGMYAALFMANTRSVVRAKLTSSLTPAASLTQANALLCSDAARGVFVTLFYADIDPTTRALTYVNCGHNPPYWYHARSREVTELMPTAAVLGINNQLQCKQEQIVMEPGDLLLTYTDGITEAFNEADEQFGEEPLKALLVEHAQHPPERLQTAIHTALEAFCGSAPQSDDRTIVIAKCL